MNINKQFLISNSMMRFICVILFMFFAIGIKAQDMRIHPVKSIATDNSTNVTQKNINTANNTAMVQKNTNNTSNSITPPITPRPLTKEDSLFIKEKRAYFNKNKNTDNPK